MAQHLRRIRDYPLPVPTFFPSARYRAYHHPEPEGSGDFSLRAKSYEETF